MLSLGLLVVQNAEGSCQQHASELSGRQNVWDELLKVLNFEIVTRGDDSALVEASSKFNYYFTCSLIVYDCELSDVTYNSSYAKGDTVFLHDSKELDDDL